MRTSPASLRSRPGWARALSTLLTLSLAIAPAHPTWAAAPKGTKRVLVVRTQRAADVPGTVVGRVMGYVETLLGIDGKLELVAPAALAPVEPMKAPTEGAGKSTAKLAEKGTLERADEASSQAQKAAQKKRWADALKSWTKAIALYEKALSQMGDVTPYVNALTGRAMAYFGQGFDDNGEEELAHVLAMKADLQLDAQSPPNALAIVERVRARVKAAGVLLTVKASAPKAVVFVDGRNVGEAPAVVGELAAGSHVVRIVAADHEPYGALVTIADSAVVVDAALVSKPGEPGVAGSIPITSGEALTGLEPFASSGDFGAEFLGKAKGLAKANQLDAILWTFVRKQGEDFELGAFVWDAASGKVMAVEPATVSGDLGGLQVTMLDLMEKAAGVISGTTRGNVVVGRPAIYQASNGVARVEPTSRTTDPKANEREVTKVEEVKPPSRVVEKENVEVRREKTGEAVKPDTVLTEKPTEKNRVGGYEVPPMRKPPVLPEVREESSSEFYESWWFWTLLGSVAAGSAAAIVLTTSGDDAPPGFRTTVSW